jgi:hypothetical protein
MGPYLTRLCETLAISMIGDSRPISLQVVGEGGLATSRQAESLGLIVTELVMNALKHAFPQERPKAGSLSPMIRSERIGSFRSPTTASASRAASSPRGNRDLAPASSTRCRISSMPSLRLRPVKGHDRVGHSRHLPGQSC